MHNSVQLSSQCTLCFVFNLLMIYSLKQALKVPLNLSTISDILFMHLNYIGTFQHI